ncbi:MAG: hypothetical protein AAGM33_11710 [Pseudomonadota bacterium]
MSGTKFHCSGRNGEEPPLTPAQRSNQAVWDHEIKSRRRAAWTQMAAYVLFIFAAAGFALWHAGL